MSTNEKPPARPMGDPPSITKNYLLDGLVGKRRKDGEGIRHGRSIKEEEEQVPAKNTRSSKKRKPSGPNHELDKKDASQSPKKKPTTKKRTAANKLPKKNIAAKNTKALLSTNGSQIDQGPERPKKKPKVDDSDSHQAKPQPLVNVAPTDDPMDQDGAPKTPIHQSSKQDAFKKSPSLSPLEPLSPLQDTPSPIDKWPSPREYAQSSDFDPLFGDSDILSALDDRHPGSPSDQTQIEPLELIDQDNNNFHPAPASIYLDIPEVLHPYATIPPNSFSEYHMETPDSGPFEFDEQIPVHGMPGNESEFLRIYNYDFKTWDRIPNGFRCPNLTRADLAEVNKYLRRRRLEHVESDDDDSTVSPNYLPNQNDAAQEKMDDDEDRELDKEEALGEDKKDKAEGVEEEEDTESVHGELSKEDDLDSETSGTDDDDDNDQKSIVLDGLASFFRDAAESLKSGEPVDFSSVLALGRGKGSKKLYQRIDKMFGLAVETIAEGLAAMTNRKKHTIMLQSGLVRAEEREGSSWTVFKSVYCRSSEAAESLKGLSLIEQNAEVSKVYREFMKPAKTKEERDALMEPIRKKYKKLHEDGKNIQSDLLRVKHVIEDFTRQTQHVTALHGDIQVAAVVSYTGPNPAARLASAIVLGTDSMVEILQESKISPTEVVDSWTTLLRAKQIDLRQAVGFDVVPSEAPAGNDVAEPKVSKSMPQASAPVQETSAATVNLAVPTIKSMQDYAKYCKDKFKALLKRSGLSDKHVVPWLQIIKLLLEHQCVLYGMPPSLENAITASGIMVDKIKTLQWKDWYKAFIENTCGIREWSDEQKAYEIDSGEYLEIPLITSEGRDRFSKGRIHVLASVSSIPEEKGLEIVGQVDQNPVVASAKDAPIAKFDSLSQPPPSFPAADGVEQYYQPPSPFNEPKRRQPAGAWDRFNMSRAPLGSYYPPPPLSDGGVPSRTVFDEDPEYPSNVIPYRAGPERLIPGRPRAREPSIDTPAAPYKARPAAAQFIRDDAGDIAPFKARPRTPPSQRSRGHMKPIAPPAPRALEKTESQRPVFKLDLAKAIKAEEESRPRAVQSGRRELQPLGLSQWDNPTREGQAQRERRPVGRSTNLGDPFREAQPRLPGSQQDQFRHAQPMASQRARPAARALPQTGRSSHPASGSGANSGPTVVHQTLDPRDPELHAAVRLADKANGRRSYRVPL
ncbi:hypothetical protein C8J56DRAFT_1048108 [Mycena floridula]|nr:hypothetical protein C8J56DRAFT_1048108 [Mycena floridula]